MFDHDNMSDPLPLEIVEESVEDPSALVVHCFDGDLKFPIAFVVSNPKLLKFAGGDTGGDVLYLNFVDVFKKEVLQNQSDEEEPEVAERHVHDVHYMRVLYKTKMWAHPYGWKNLTDPKFASSLKMGRMDLLRDICAYSKRKTLSTAGFDVLGFHRNLKHGCSFATMLKSLAPISEKEREGLISFICEWIETYVKKQK